MNFEFKTKKPTALDIIIAGALHELQETKVNSEEYTQLVDQLVKLYKLREQDASKRVSPDTLATIAGNLAGILFVLHYEHVHVVTSKAFNLIMKNK